MNLMSKQPKAEEILFRMAIDHLTERQRKIWEMWNYDRLTQDEMALKLKIRRQSVAESISKIEDKIKKFVTINKGAYILLKMEQQIHQEDEE
jgi:predicted DNA-binding protein YlxM (UPF0122 family)